jgi:hypothetical protein
MVAAHARSVAMSQNQPNPAALAVRDSGAIDPWRGVEWQRLWLALQARPWAALAVIPASSGGPPDFAVLIAMTLARTGMIHLNAPIHVADAVDLQLGNVKVFQNEIAEARESGGRILLALAPIGENPVSETLVQATDGAVLCVLLDRMDSSGAARTVERLGKNRFVGSIVFRPDDFR